MLPAAEDGEKFFAGARIDGLFRQFASGLDCEADLIDVELAPVALADVEFKAPLVRGRKSALDIVGNQLD